jgi:transcriptional regulator GlxA family with amidase domain
VQHAITLLQTTKLKGLDVALACGFCDETQMARWFGRLRRCLPSAVRKAASW